MKQTLASVTTCHHMVDRAGKLHAKWSSQAHILAVQMRTEHEQANEKRRHQTPQIVVETEKTACPQKCKIANRARLSRPRVISRYVLLLRRVRW